MSSLPAQRLWCPSIAKLPLPWDQKGTFREDDPRHPRWLMLPTRRLAVPLVPTDGPVAMGRGSKLPFRGTGDWCLGTGGRAGTVTAAASSP